jgi:hypothetical protein
VPPARVLLGEWPERGLEFSPAGSDLQKGTRMRHSCGSCPPIRTASCLGGQASPCSLRYVIPTAVWPTAVARVGEIDRRSLAPIASCTRSPPPPSRNASNCGLPGPDFQTHPEGGGRSAHGLRSLDTGKVSECGARWPVPTRHVAGNADPIDRYLRTPCAVAISDGYRRALRLFPRRDALVQANAGWLPALYRGHP